MLKVLSIGNSFSRDAQKYLHQVLDAAGVENKIADLYIGGCSLERHYNNLMADAAAYEYDINGEFTGEMRSIAQTVAEDDWDFITLQQASHDSGLLPTYQPYIGILYRYVTEHAPQAKILLHETWAYEQDSTHPQFVRYQRSQRNMHTCIHAAWQSISHQLGAPIIPCGDVIAALRKKPEFRYEDGGKSLCRDGFHMHLQYGRYALAATWMKVLTGKSILGNTYLPPDLPNEPLDKELFGKLQGYLAEILDA